MEEATRSMRALVACTIILAGCQVRGLVGSNESAAEGASASGSDGVGPGGGGVDSTDGDPSGGTGGTGAASGNASGITWGDGEDESTSDEPLRFDVSSGGDSAACAPPTFPCRWVLS